MSTVILVLMILGCAFAAWDSKAKTGYARMPWHHTLRTWLWSVVLLVRGRR